MCKGSGAFGNNTVPSGNIGRAFAAIKLVDSAPASQPSGNASAASPSPKTVVLDRRQFARARKRAAAVPRVWRRLRAARARRCRARPPPRRTARGCRGGRRARRAAPARARACATADRVGHAAFDGSRCISVCCRLASIRSTIASDPTGARNSGRKLARSCSCANRATQASASSSTPPWNGSYQRSPRSADEEVPGHADAVHLDPTAPRDLDHQHATA